MKNFIQLFAAFCLLVFTMNIKAQNIYTTAGDGNFGYSGDGEPATANNVELNYPSGIFIDKAGSIYIADVYNSVIRKINTSGIINTIIGNHILGSGYNGDGGQATSAQINLPDGICSDSSNNLYIADYGNNVIRKVNASGIISTVAGNGHRGYSGDGGQATSAELGGPVDVFSAPSGILYIAEYSGQRIRKVTTNGIISTVAGNGIGGYSGDEGPATAAEMWCPISLFVDSVNNIYFTDNVNGVIRKINSSGIIGTIAGDSLHGYSGDGGLATAAEIGYPSGIWMDQEGNLYFADAENDYIRKIDVSGIISTIGGNGYRPGLGGYSGDGGVATDAELNNPWGVACDVLGNVYISDHGNSVIREILVDTATGINTIANNNNIMLFPNPANNTVTINFNSRLTNGLVTLKIMDITGREVMTYVKDINSSSLRIDITNLASGMYFISAANNAVSFSQKFIKN